MTPDPVAIDPTDVLAVAEEKMVAGHFRHLPVVNEAGELVGILARSDLLAHTGYLARTRVDAAMTEKLITARPEEPLEHAAALLFKHKIGGLPVLDSGGALVGIVTESDLLHELILGLTGDDETSARIDFRFQEARQTFADAVRIVETAGATVLGLGTQRNGETANEHTFFLRFRSDDPSKIADELGKSGYGIQAVHVPSTAM